MLLPTIHLAAMLLWVSRRYQFICGHVDQSPPRWIEQWTWLNENDRQDTTDIWCKEFPSWWRHVITSSLEDRCVSYWISPYKRQGSDVSFGEGSQVPTADVRDLRLRNTTWLPQDPRPLRWRKAFCGFPHRTASISFCNRINETCRCLHSSGLCSWPCRR